MPFIKNFDLKTRLHLCEEEQDFKTADILLNYLSGAPLDHHSREIVDLLPKLINIDIPSLNTYFEKRILPNPSISDFKRG